MVPEPSRSQQRPTILQRKSVVKRELQRALIESHWGRFETAPLIFTLPYVIVTLQDDINLLQLCVCIRSVTSWHVCFFCLCRVVDQINKVGYTLNPLV